MLTSLRNLTLLVVSMLCITLNWNTDSLTSFVTAKGSEYTLRRCARSKPHLRSFLSAVGAGRFSHLIIKLYIILHVRLSMDGVGEEGSNSPLCTFKSTFQGQGIADNSQILLVMLAL